VKALEKNKLLVFPLSSGIALIVYSWFFSYPLSIGFPGDFVFNHVSVLYWFGLALTLASMYIIAVTSKHDYVKWIMTVGIVVAMCSLSYFFYMLPGSDSPHTRGLTEFFIKTKNLDSSQPSRGYFQWPLFFIFANTMTSVTGLGEAAIEFLVYALIGFLMTTALYIYASKVFKNGGFLAVIAFIVVMFNTFLNYQFAPFSLAFDLLLLLFMLETRQPRTGSLVIATLVLFVGITLTHAFVPIFFILYLLIQSVLTRNKQYGQLFLLALTIYLLVELAMASTGFASSILSMMGSLPTEYSQIVTIRRPPVPIDAIAQALNGIVEVSFGIACLAGFILLLVKRKMRNLDKAVFLTGLIYSSVGAVLYTLGSRAIPMAFIPISLGAVYLFESKLRLYLACLFLILLSLFVFIPLNASFSSTSMVFQTKDAYTTANFMIEKYNWNRHSTVLSHSSDRWYIDPQVEGNSELDEDSSSNPKSLNVTIYDSVIYSIGLAQSFEVRGVSEENALRQILDKFNVVYDSGSSYIAEKPR
jgi:hypothetical protein